MRDFREHGQKAIAKVRRDQPGVYLKVLALLIPRQDKLEHTNTIKTMTDDELESAIAILNEMMAAQAVGSAHLIETKAETAALPAPSIRDKAPTSPIEGQRFHHNLEIIERSTA